MFYELIENKRNFLINIFYFSIIYSKDKLHMMILNILFKFAFEHIEQICVSDVSVKAVPRNCSLKIDRKFTVICSSKFYVYL